MSMVQGSICIKGKDTSPPPTVFGVLASRGLYSWYGLLEFCLLIRLDLLLHLAPMILWSYRWPPWSAVAPVDTEAQQTLNSLASLASG